MSALLGTQALLCALADVSHLKVDQIRKLLKLLQAWRNFKSRRQYLSETLTRALASWKSQILAQAFAGWQQGALAMQRKRLLLNQALSVFKHRWAPSAGLCKNIIHF